jgi:YD repeat-containing protein
LTCLAALSPAIALADQVFDAWGFNQNRDYFSQLPYEHIDPMTGNLLLTFTDVVLPGNAGFDLRIQRTYNSKIYRDYNDKGDTLGEDSWAGVGWTLLVARVLNPFFPNKPIIEMADGSRHQTYNHVSGNGTFITRDFWQYRSVPNPVLSLPNGVTYSFGRQATIGGLGTVLLATEVRDPFGNRVVIEYASGVNVPPDALTRITQFLGGTTREVTFTYDGAMGRNSLRTMTLSAGGRAYTWNYVQTDAAGNLKTRNDPQFGRSEFFYDANNRRVRIDRPGAAYDTDISYDASDNRTRLANGFVGSTFVYDGANRLTSRSDALAGRSYTTGYSYDGNDNLSELRYPSGRRAVYAYDAEDRILSITDGAGADSFSYDANGNLIGRNGASFGFMPENMLETATVGAATTVYRYDGDNLRKQKSGKDTTQYFFHGPADRLVSEFDEPCSGTVRWVRDYVYAGARVLATVKSPPVETRVEFVAGESSASEAAGTAPVGVRVSTSNAAALVCPVGVDYASSDETGVAGLDYTAAAGRLTFAAGSPSGTVQTIAVGLLDDALDEPDETFRLDLSNVSGAVAGLAQHRVTIVDDDLPPELSVGDVTLVEGDGGEQSAVFNLTLSAPSGLEVRVSYSTEDIIARAPSDYTAVSGTVTFPPGATSQPVQVQVLGDTFYEADETYRLVLQNSVNATVSRAAGVGTIVNDDPQPPGVPFLTTTSTSGQVKLEWTNPEVGPYASTVIRYRAVSGQSSCTFPEGPGEGELLVSQPGALGAHDDYLHRDLPNDNTTYCYAAFVELELDLFSRARTIKGRPFDTSGAVKWAYGTGATTVEPPGLGPGIYAGSNDRILHGITRSAGGGDWLSGWRPVLLGGPLQSRPPVRTALIPEANQVVFASSQDGYVYAVNAETGRVLWRSPERLGEVLQAAVSGMFRSFGGAFDYLLVGSRNASGGNRFYALNPIDGTVVGTPFDNGGGANAIGIISAQASVDYATRRVFFASRALAGGSPNTVWCLSLTDSGLSFEWAQALGDVDGSPVVSNGRVYAGTNEGVVYSLDANDGRVLWSYATGDGPVKGFIFPDSEKRPAVLLDHDPRLGAHRRERGAELATGRAAVPLDGALHTGREPAADRRGRRQDVPVGCGLGRPRRPSGDSLRGAG